MSYSYGDSAISGVHMSSISTEPTQCYTPYGLSAPARRDDAEAAVSSSPGQPLPAHALFHHHAAAANQHHQSRPPHVVIPQYHAHQLQVSAASAHRHTPVTSAVVGDGAVPYQTGTLVPYAQAMHHAHRPAGAHHPGFNPISSAAVGSAPVAITPGAAVDQEYSVMTVAGPWGAPAPSVGLPPPQAQAYLQQQQQQQHHQQQQQQQQLSYHGPANPNMRFDCILEAPTAAAQKADESSLTYLNKGQLYGITMMDKTHSDAIYNTTLRIAFHEDSHRKSAGTYWTFWLNQQEHPRAARAIDLDKAGSIGVISAENKRFDRVTFQWQGYRGAKVMVRFNCLSTDFSRIKGVKGISLRIHLDTHYAVPQAAGPSAGPSAVPASPRTTSQPPTAVSILTPISPSSTNSHNMHDQQHTDSSVATFSMVPAAAQVPGAAYSNIKLVCGEVVERCYARIKLFRDKGAERKNKDDQRHMDKLWGKQKTKLAMNGSTPTFQQQQFAEFTMSFAPVQPLTSFLEYTLADDECDLDETTISEDMWLADGSPFPAAFAAQALESPGSLSTTPVTGISSMNIGLPCASLGAMGSPLAAGSTAAAIGMRKRPSEDVESQGSSKRRPSSPSLSLSGTASASGPVGTKVVGVDPMYVPTARKHTPVLVVYVRFRGESVYRAIYLDELTTDDLVTKLAQRLEIQTEATEVEVVRKTKKGLTVKIDDHVISQLDDEQDMEIACSFASDTGALTIYLHY